ncbi:hypothetical protein [Asaia astilbis]|uniref:hypothetical protein n=1 Tax=Asaia astilbis TaxID=610244 RepID=UPI001E41191F|nr:hypothetical protein [Asaia astilbis]
MMRKAALLAIPLVLSGCSGLGKSLQDTATLPGANPNMPEGVSENLEKVKGHTYMAMPLLPESGNIWPGAPQPLPTLRDVEASPNGLRDAMSDTDSYFGSMTKGMDASGAQLGDGGALSIGEHDGVVNGVHPVQRPSLSSSVEDNAHKYISPSRSGTIVIPNGDGTSTHIDLMARSA